MTIAELEKRVARMEADLSLLKLQENKKSPDAWWEATHGTFEDDEAFREAMQLGRKWRESDLPKLKKKSKAKRK